eukprot:gnl/TRDRNA2_/TRDRNA2_174949_c12_seq13.p1 gnl/TRDRNA2_/TRDRNA2_174949_c12~~gnl/TRDRNA2_/TRDRNA2_174949_c12_seq13.p1  ORF type:complete len:152 (+),score=14.00 gnl/TRDRNA2_/TRDRNA2_174949_c12_seq13:396-851(+)
MEMASSSAGSGCSTFANAHTVLACSYALNSLTRHSAAVARPVKSFSSGRFTAANAHAVLARHRILKPSSCRVAAFASPAKSFTSDCPADAQPHAMLAHACAVNAIVSCWAASASALNRCESNRHAVAKDPVRIFLKKSVQQNRPAQPTRCC